MQTGVRVTLFKSLLLQKEIKQYCTTKHMVDSKNLQTGVHYELSSIQNGNKKFKCHSFFQVELVIIKTIGPFICTYKFLHVC